MYLHSRGSHSIVPRFEAVGSSQVAGVMLPIRLAVSHFSFSPMLGALGPLTQQSLCRLFSKFWDSLHGTANEANTPACGPVLIGPLL